MHFDLYAYVYWTWGICIMLPLFYELVAGNRKVAAGLWARIFLKTVLLEAAVAAVYFWLVFGGAHFLGNAAGIVMFVLFGGIVLIPVGLPLCLLFRHHRKHRATGLAR